MLIGMRPPRSMAPLAANGPPSPFGAEAVVLELQQHRDREAVVQLGDVDVVRAEAGRAEQGPATARAGRAVMLSRISTGNCIPGCGAGPLPWATARISAGGLAAVARPARRWSRPPRTAPSVSRQKSYSRSGPEIIRAAR